MSDGLGKIDETDASIPDEMRTFFVDGVVGEMDALLNNRGG